MDRPEALLDEQASRARYETMIPGAADWNTLSQESRLYWSEVLTHLRGSDNLSAFNPEQRLQIQRYTQGVVDAALRGLL